MPSSMNWADGAVGGTPISAANLNKLAVTADVGTAGTPTGDALRAAFAPAPAYAGPRQGRFASATSLYNAPAANLLRLRAALATARSGTGLCRWFFAGDSLTAGYGTGNISGTNDSITQLGPILQAAGLTVTQTFHGFNGALNPKFTAGGSGPPAGWGLTFPWGTIPAGGTVTLTGTGTVFEMIATNAGGGVSYSIDSGALQNFVPSGTLTITPVTVTGLSAGAHTVTIQNTGAGSTAYFYAAGFRNATGMVLENGGVVSSHTGQWLDNYATFSPLWSALERPAAIKPDIVSVELVVNDANTFTATDYHTNLDGIVTRIQSAGSQAVLIASNLPTGAGATYYTFLSAIYDVADARGVPILDLADRFGPFATASAAGLNSDSVVHLSPTGNAFKAQALTSLLT